MQLLVAGFLLLQPGLAGAQPAPDVAPKTVIETVFEAGLPPDQVRPRLELYYREQLGKASTEILGELGPGLYFDNWRRFYLSVKPSAAGSSITLRRAADSAQTRSVKSWMLEVAGRLLLEGPLSFHEAGAVQAVSLDVFGSRRDVAEAVKRVQPELRPMPSKLSALFVAPDPFTEVELESGGSNGMNRLQVIMEKQADARSLLAKIQQSFKPARIAGVVDETTVVEQDLQKQAAEVELQTRMRAMGTLLTMGTGSRVFEDKVRNTPEMQKRLAAARDVYLVKYRLDQPYRKLVFRWSRLPNYSQTGGSLDGEVPLTQAAQANAVRTDGAEFPSVRLQIPAIQPGAYRIRMDAEKGVGPPVALDDRTFWFDGKRFDEL
jgi:hypothetical protein